MPKKRHKIRCLPALMAIIKEKPHTFVAVRWGCSQSVLNDELAWWHNVA